MFIAKRDLIQIYLWRIKQQTFNVLFYWLKCFNVLQGAEKTIVENKPVIIVEQKPNKGTKFGLSDTAAVDYLQSLGMKIHAVMAGDYIMVW